MNYLGRSIIDEVRSTTTDSVTDLIPDVDNTYDLGSSAKRWHELYVTNNLPLDNRSLPTQLPNGMFASMCHPMRFSNGVPSGNLEFVNDPVRNYILSGFGTSSAYTDSMTSLKYAGTYRYCVKCRFDVVGSATPVFGTSLTFLVKIGTRTVCQPFDLALILSDSMNVGDITVAGTIDMLQDAQEETSVSTTMTVSFTNRDYVYSRTYTNFLTDVNTTTNSHYSMEVQGLTLAVGKSVNLIRHVGTLECIHSNVAPVTS
jgi:hypothetical protein